jgi:hypothetical protein
MKITHPQKVAYTLNSYFIDMVELVKENRSKDSDRSSQILANFNPNYIYIFSISEVSKLKGKDSAGYYEIPGLLVKEFILKTLNFIFNESINLGVFPDLLKIEKN